MLFGSFGDMCTVLLNVVQRIRFLSSQTATLCHQESVIVIHRHRFNINRKEESTRLNRLSFGNLASWHCYKQNGDWPNCQPIRNNNHYSAAEDSSNIDTEDFYHSLQPKYMRKFFIEMSLAWQWGRLISILLIAVKASTVWKIIMV